MEIDDDNNSLESVESLPSLSLLLKPSTRQTEPNSWTQPSKAHAKATSIDTPKKESDIVADVPCVDDEVQNEYTAFPQQEENYCQPIVDDKMIYTECSQDLELPSLKENDVNKGAMHALI